MNRNTWIAALLGLVAAFGGVTARAQAPEDELARYDQARQLYQSKRYGEALQRFRALAEAGYPPAMMSLAYQLESGQGTRVDAPGARSWYRAAARRGMVPAFLRLAMMYQEGDTVPRNPVLAQALYLVAAKLNPNRVLVQLAKASAEELKDEEQTRQARQLAERIMAQPQNLDEIIRQARRLGQPVM